MLRSHPDLPDPSNPDSTMSDAQRGLLQQLQIHHPEVANPRHEISEKEEGSKEETEVARTNEKRLYEEAVRWAAQVSEEHNRTLDGLPRRALLPLADLMMDSPHRSKPGRRRFTTWL